MVHIIEIPKIHRKCNRMKIFLIKVYLNVIFCKLKILDD